MGMHLQCTGDPTCDGAVPSHWDLHASDDGRCRDGVLKCERCEQLVDVEMVEETCGEHLARGGEGREGEWVGMGGECVGECEGYSWRCLGVCEWEDGSVSWVQRIADRNERISLIGTNIVSIYSAHVSGVNLLYNEGFIRMICQIITEGLGALLSWYNLNSVNDYGTA
jgi:hypothetical protein